VGPKPLVGTVVSNAAGRMGVSVVSAVCCEVEVSASS
jgi:hypothetical protein